MKLRIKNKKRFGIILSIVLVLTAMISGTYSLFYRENVASNAESYSTGILNIVAKSKSDNINLTNALPMTDEEGVLTEPYVFTIENTGNLDYNFNIRLLSTNEDPIDPQYIKLKIDDGEVTTLSSLPNSVIKDNITLKAKEVMDVSIRIWLASDTPNTEIGKSFNSKIVTEGQAVYTEVNNEDGTLSNSEHRIVNLVKYIENLYNTAEKTVVTAPSDASDSTKTLDYNYATSVNLMNDRLGGTTEDLDGGNIRYYGASPKNYIDIGDRTSDNKVILWRILGVFDGKVRVIRHDSIGNYSWDTSASNVNSGDAINEWSQADIMKLLNPGYDNNKDLNNSNETITVNNSLYYNSGSGTCYNGRSNVTTECDFTNTGLSESVKDKIVDQTIYLGGGNKSSIYTNQAYTMERGDTVVIPGTTCSGSYCNDSVTRTLTWTGKVGLMYPSDYGYAVDLTSCQNNLLYYDNTTCKINDWLVKSSYQWFVAPSSAVAYSAWYVNSDGYVGSGSIVYNAYGVRPVLTLSSELVIESGGEGTSTKPYVLKS